MTAFTFLFTDIENSTRLWEEHGAGMRRALARANAGDAAAAAAFLKEQAAAVDNGAGPC